VVEGGVPSKTSTRRSSNPENDVWHVDFAELRSDTTTVAVECALGSRQTSDEVLFRVISVAVNRVTTRAMEFPIGQ
jgi:hypothetical protein